MQRFTDLRVWHRSFQFGMAIYGLCKKLPVEERFEMSSQLRRAAVSVSTNIAEGAKCLSLAEYAHFLNIAERSNAEIQSLLLCCQGLGFAEGEDYAALLSESTGIGLMLHALRTKVAAKAVNVS